MSLEQLAITICLLAAVVIVLVFVSGPPGPPPPAGPPPPLVSDLLAWLESINAPPISDLAAWLEKINAEIVSQVVPLHRRRDLRLRGRDRIRCGADRAAGAGDEGGDHLAGGDVLFWTIAPAPGLYIIGSVLAVLVDENKKFAGVISLAILLGAIVYLLVALGSMLALLLDATDPSRFKRPAGEEGGRRHQASDVPPPRERRQPTHGRPQSRQERMSPGNSESFNA